MTNFICFGSMNRYIPILWLLHAGDRVKGLVNTVSEMKNEKKKKKNKK